MLLEISVGFGFPDRSFCWVRKSQGGGQGTGRPYLLARVCEWPGKAAVHESESLMRDRRWKVLFLLVILIMIEAAVL